MPGAGSVELRRAAGFVYILGVHDDPIGGPAGPAGEYFGVNRPLFVRDEAGR
jgi:hypothetical protein